MFVVGCRTFYQIREHILSHKRTRRMCSLAVSCSRAVYWCGGACLSMCVCVHLCARARTRGRVGACACACACASAHMHARSRAHTRRTAHARRCIHAHRYTLACTHVQTRGVENGTERARAIEWEGVGWRVECVGERRTFICCTWVQRHAPLLSSCLAHSSLVLARFFFWCWAVPDLVPNTAFSLSLSVLSLCSLALALALASSLTSPLNFFALALAF